MEEEPVAADSKSSTMGMTEIALHCVRAISKPSSVVSVQIPVTRNVYSVLGKSPVMRMDVEP